MRRWLGALALVLPFAVGLGVASAAPDPLAEKVTTFADPELAESSGLAVIDKQWVSVNDSGDIGRLFVVDPKTGKTLRTVHFADAPVDVEALAPEGSGSSAAVWAGDIGDNRGRRPHVTLYRVPLAGDEAVRSIDLRYPDGPRDAEALLRHPVSGEMLVVSKEIFGGTVYRVPKGGDGVRELQRIGSAPSLITDGAFLPDGKHLVLRNYARGFMLTWPGLEQVASFALPNQQQGEAIAVAADGSLLLSSEGVHAPVWRMAPPPLTTATPSASPTPEPGGTAQPEGAAEPSAPGPDRTWWFVGGGFAAGAVLLFAAAARRRNG